MLGISIPVHPEKSKIENRCKWKCRYYTPSISTIRFLSRLHYIFLSRLHCTSASRGFWHHLVTHNYVHSTSISQAPSPYLDSLPGTRTGMSMLEGEAAELFNKTGGSCPFLIMRLFCAPLTRSCSAPPSALSTVLRSTARPQRQREQLDPNATPLRHMRSTGGLQAGQAPTTRDLVHIDMKGSTQH